MTALTTAPLAPLLERLFAEADGAGGPALNLGPEERERLLRSRTEYLEFYGKLKDFWMPVTRDTGMLLYMLARSSRAETIVEFGTSFGISTLFLAAGLRDNGGGRLITTEFEPSKVERARRHIAEAGVADLVEFRAGDALGTLAVDMPESIDLVLLDGAKALYPDILRLVEPRLRPGAMIVADNVEHSPEYMALIRRPDSGYVSTPFDEDVELTMWLG